MAKNKKSRWALGQQGSAAAASGTGRNEWRADILCGNNRNQEYRVWDLCVQSLSRNYDDSMFPSILALRLDKCSDNHIRSAAFRVCHYLQTLFTFLPGCVKSQIQANTVNVQLRQQRHSTPPSPREEEWVQLWAPFLAVSRHVKDLFIWDIGQYWNRRRSTTIDLTVVALEILHVFRPIDTVLFERLEVLSFHGTSNRSLEYLWSFGTHALLRLCLILGDGVDSLYTNAMLHQLPRKFPLLRFLLIRGRPFDENSVRANLMKALVELKHIERLNIRDIALDKTSLVSLSKLHTIKELAWGSDYNADNNYAARLPSVFHGALHAQRLVLELPIADLLLLLQPRRNVRDLTIHTYLTSVADLSTLCTVISKSAPDLRCLRLFLLDPWPRDSPGPNPLPVLNENGPMTTDNRVAMLWEIAEAYESQLRVRKGPYTLHQDKMSDSHVQSFQELLGRLTSVKYSQSIWRADNDNTAVMLDFFTPEFEVLIRDAYFNLQRFKVHRLASQKHLPPPFGVNGNFRTNEVFMSGAAKAAEYSVSLQPRSDVPVADRELIFQAYLIIQPRPVKPSICLDWSATFGLLYSCTHLRNLSITMPPSQLMARYEVIWRSQDVQKIATRLLDLEELSLVFNEWIHPLLPSPEVTLGDLAVLTGPGSKIRYLKVPFDASEIAPALENQLWLQSVLHNRLQLGYSRGVEEDNGKDSVSQATKTVGYDDSVMPTDALRTIILWHACRMKPSTLDVQRVAAWIGNHWPEVVIEVDRYFGSPEIVHSEYDHANVLQSLVKSSRARRMESQKRRDTLPKNIHTHDMTDGPPAPTTRPTQLNPVSVAIPDNHEDVLEDSGSGARKTEATVGDRMGDIVRATPP